MRIFEERNKVIEMGKHTNRKGKKLVIAIIVIAVLAIAVRIILFPPVKDIPVTGQYSISSEDYCVICL